MESDREPRTTVISSDLDGLGVLHEILRVLNDPAASAGQLGRMVDRFPVLANRVRAATKKGKRVTRSTGEAIVLLGNRGFEGVLLQLLEDLTVLRAELGPEGQLPEMSFV